MPTCDYAESEFQLHTKTYLVFQNRIKRSPDYLKKIFGGSMDRILVEWVGHLCLSDQDSL